MGRSIKGAYSMSDEDSNTQIDIDLYEPDSQSVARLAELTAVRSNLSTGTTTITFLQHDINSVHPGTGEPTNLIVAGKYILTFLELLKLTQALNNQVQLLSKERDRHQATEASTDETDT